MVAQLLAITFLGYVCFNYHRLNIQLKVHAPSADIRTSCFLEQIYSGAVQYSCFCISQVVIFLHLVTLGTALYGLLRYEFDSFILVGFFFFSTSLWPGGLYDCFLTVFLVGRY